MIAMKGRFALGVVALVALPACGSSSTSPSTTSAMLHADVSDPAGDVVVDPRVAIPPDLVGATADVVGGSVTFVVQFAPGTLNRLTTRVAVVIDTDRNGSTGISQGNGLGADYALDLVANIAQATITKADPVACAARQTCFNPVSSVALSFATDSMQVTVPLTMLGSADGQLCFQMHSYILFGINDAVTVDFMPNNGGACIISREAR